jgi:hypothetical protein
MFPRGFTVCDNDCDVSGKFRLYRDVELYNAPPDYVCCDDNIELCPVCRRDPRIWVLLLPCYHKLCVMCAHEFNKRTCDKCPLCRQQFTMEIPHIPHLDNGEWYVRDEPDLMYKSMKLSVAEDGMKLLRFKNHAAIERRLIARRLLMDIGREDVVSKDAAMHRMNVKDNNTCALCSSTNAQNQTSCCLFRLCVECTRTYQRIEKFRPTKIDRCTICASSTRRRHEIKS